MSRFIIYLVLLLSVAPCTAQLTLERLNTEIKKIQSKNIDTVFCFVEPLFVMPWIDSIPGIGDRFINVVAYCFYIKKEQLYTRKYIACDKATGGSEYYLSNEVLTDSGSLYYWLTKNASYIKDDVIYPCIFQTGEGDSIKYKVLEKAHPSIYKVGLYTRQNAIYYPIESDDVLQFSSGVKNLNYVRNVNTALYKAYVRLKAFAEQLQNKNLFEKYNLLSEN